MISKGIFLAIQEKKLDLRRILNQSLLLLMR